MWERALPPFSSHKLLWLRSMSLHLRYRFSKAQHQGGNSLSLTDAEILIDAGKEVATAHLSAPTRPVPKRLIEASNTTLASVRDRLPSGLNKQVAVETGMITEEWLSAGKMISRRKRAYTLASCRGVIIALQNSLGATAQSPWRKAADEGDGIRMLPVVLGPSAALAVLIHLLEFSGPLRDLPAGRQTKLHISELDSSPYPPEAFFDSSSEMRRGWEPRKDASCLPWPKPLLLRYELWSRPFAALFQDGLHHWSISSDTQVRWPSAALVLDTLVPLDCCPGAIDWEATYSVRKQSEVVAGICTLMRLRFEPRELLSRVYGAIGEMRAACVDDPIAGKQFGLAAPLASDLLAENILFNLHDFRDTT